MAGLAMEPVHLSFEVGEEEWRVMVCSAAMGHARAREVVSAG